MSVLTFLFRWRIVVVSVLVAVAAGLAAVTLCDFAIPADALFLAGISFVTASAVAYAHLRHLGLALVSVLAPLPGMMATASFMAALPDTAVLAIYGLGIVAAALLAGDIVCRVLEGQGPVDAAREALAGFTGPAAVSALAGSPLLIGWLFHEAQALGLTTAAVMLSAIFSATAIVPFAASVMRFGEGFFTVANRARERGELLLRLAPDVTVPRWGLSATGVTVVFAVLGWFGAAPLLARSAFLAQPAPWLASALGLAIVGLVVARDVRATVASLLALAAVFLVDLWLWGRAVGHLAAPAFIVIIVTEVTALLIVLTLVSRQRGFRRGGDDAPAARLRAIEESGATPWFACSAAAAAVFPWALVHGATAILAALFLGAAAAALLAAPAIETAIETVLPRRHSVDELYARRRG